MRNWHDLKNNYRQNMLPIMLDGDRVSDPMLNPLSAIVPPPENF